MSDPFKEVMGKLIQEELKKPEYVARLAEDVERMVFAAIADAMSAAGEALKQRHTEQHVKPVKILGGPPANRRSSAVRVDADGGQEKMYTFEEAAKFVGCKVSTIWAWSSSKKLHAIKQKGSAFKLLRHSELVHMKATYRPRGR